MSEIPVILNFPLPFRVLVLSSLGILGWATNLHGLDLAKVDVVGAMDLRVEAAVDHLPPLRSATPKSPSSPAIIYSAVYRLCAAYSFWVFLSWAAFRYVTYGNMVLVDAFGYIPAISALVVLLVLVCPIDAFWKRERDKFLHAVRRCVFTPMDGTVYFADVVFADIFTSFAKVLGDVWLSACMLLPGNTLFRTPADGPLPYLIRLKQCLIEYSHPSNQSRRPLFNALKYATSFPVIYLSAAQRIVVTELVREKGDDIANEAWHGEHLLLAAAINSLYSFWWDVTNDWGLSLLKPNDSSRNRPLPPRRLLLSSPEEHHATATNHERQQHPYGLRSTLLYPLPVYPLVVFLNLVLRLTWSIKLSSHLHSKTDGSVTIFWLEMAEVVRRWMWVFVRIEWEVIKKMEQGPRRGENEQLLDDEGDYEMVLRTSEDGRIP
ncbi:EXS family-domain-containing protein [Roridomyces roridus]|uniref:EXS family-domain-containing protein n=1 Tax=Roridomyces roridus TaxID=1738132 RepID=A0AAD7FZZ4_9AGAR|nr:EXS family-domain-containing protein [Roridomyces roridus]